MAVAPMSPGSSVCMQVSSNNQLLLTGNVPSPADKDRIQQLIQQSVGNQQVVNQIQTSNVNNRR